jgi:hypothetical protein
MYARVGGRTALTSFCTVPAHSLLVCWLHAVVLASHAVHLVQRLSPATACATRKVVVRYTVEAALCKDYK